MLRGCAQGRVGRDVGEIQTQGLIALDDGVRQRSWAELAWSGSVAVLVNGATAGSGEALASLMQAERGCLVLGEATYGLGSEVKLYEMEDGSGLLVSSALWETASGSRWNDEGVQPDELVHGRGDDYAAMSADQLSKVLDHLEQRSATTEPATEREAA